MRAYRLEMVSCASICRQRNDGLSQCGEALGFVKTYSSCVLYEIFLLGGRYYD